MHLCVFSEFFILFMYFLFWGLGGLKLWEGSLDLVKALRSEVENGHLAFTGKRVLEVGILIIW